MNWDIAKGKWKELQGQARTKWGKLTDDDLQQAAGDRDRFVGRIQQRYGIEKDKAEREVDDWMKTM